MTPDERAEGILVDLERRGIQPLDDLGWMNPEDRAAITDPIADAIRAAVLEEREAIAAAALAESEDRRGRLRFPESVALRHFAEAIRERPAP